MPVVVLEPSPKNIVPPERSTVPTVDPIFKSRPDVGAAFGSTSETDPELNVTFAVPLISKVLEVTPKLFVACGSMLIVAPLIVVVPAVNVNLPNKFTVPAVKLIVGVPEVVKLFEPAPMVNVPDVLTVRVPFIVMLPLIAMLKLPEPLIINAPFAPIVWLPLVSDKVPAVCSQVPAVKTNNPDPAIETLIEQTTLLATEVLLSVTPLNRVVVPVPEIVWSPVLVKVTLQRRVVPFCDMSNVPLLVKLPPMLIVLVNVPDD